MKRVAIVTIQDSWNIGNRLQNYALQDLIEKRGFEVYNLNDGYSDPLYPSLDALVKDKIKAILGALGLSTFKKKHLIFARRYKRLMEVDSFTSKYIHHILKVDYNGVDLDFFLGIVGSDQVWHKWKDQQDELSYYYLSFLPEYKRAAYGASFGFNCFPKKDIDQHIHGLLEMRYISCREQSGCDLVKSVTGRDVTHVLDPTLLLEDVEWRRLERDTNNYSKKIANSEPYAFNYFLGSITDKYQRVINRKCNELGIKKVINFNDLTDKHIASCGPIEFLYFIDHASYIFTDSFHATVFSILFNKSFLSFQRQQEGFMNMFGRVEELLKMTGHDNCAYGGIREDTKAENFNTIKQRSLNYIDMILDIDTNAHR